MRQVFHKLTKKRENTASMCDFRVLTQSTLIGNFVSLGQIAPFLFFGNAKRPENIEFFFQRASAHALRRHGPDPAILQQLEAASPFATLCADSLSGRGLSSQRSDPGSDLFPDRRTAPHQP